MDAHFRKLAQISEAWEMPQILALAREHGFDAVQAALEDVKQDRLKAIQESFGTTCEESIRSEVQRHGAIDVAIETERDPAVRLNHRSCCRFRQHGSRADDLDDPHSVEFRHQGLLR